MQQLATKHLTAPITKSPTNGSGSFEFLIHSLEIDLDNERVQNFVGLPTTVPIGYMHMNFPGDGVRDPGAFVGEAKAYSDPVGLHGYGKLDLEQNPLAVGIYERMLLGPDHPLHLGELSIGFSYDVTKSLRGAQGELVLPNCRVHEISIVVAGAQRSQVMNLKAARAFKCRRGHLLAPPRVLAKGTHPASRCETCGSINVFARTRSQTPP